MPRGLPDYYNPSLEVSQRMVDLAGIIAAQTGVSPVDGLGRPFFVDNFREGLTGWVLSAGGDGFAPVADTTIAYVPPASVKADVGSAVGIGSSGMLRNVHVGSRGRFGLELSLMRISGDTILRMTLTHVLDSLLRTGLVDIHTSSGDVILQHATGNATIANIGTASISNQWIVLKLVADYGTRKYERFLIGSKRYDISQYSMVQAGSANNGLLQTNIVGFGNDATFRLLRVGHVIITLDEP